MLLRHDRKSEFGDEFLKGGENVTPRIFTRVVNRALGKEAKN
jgi:hypothetical protein